MELRSAIEHVTGTMYSMNHIETLWQEFDKDDNGTIDAPEFRTLMKYIKNPPRVSFRKSVSSVPTEKVK
jgi:Ca2+-binding EF-hand superfamily protein